MNFDDVRAIFSVIMFALLISIYIWAWSKNRKQDFNEAANLPFNEPETPALDTNLKTSENTSGEKV